MGKTQIAGYWYAIFAGFCLVVLYLPFTLVPFLQDDFVFLYHAKQRATDGQWLDWARAASGEATFWRPISVGLYWTIVHGVLKGSSVAAHLLNLVILGAAAVASGSLGCILARADADVPPAPSDTRGFRFRFWPVLLFGVSACWLLPVVWTCAVQETLACLFAALSLLAFTRFIASAKLPEFSPQPWKIMGWGMAALSFFALALLSKEGTVVVPALAGLIAWHLRARFDHRMVVLAVATAAIAGAWLYLRSIMTTIPENSPYTPTMGLNILRNGVALPLFLLNFPREAMVGWINSRSAPMLIWGLTCFALQTTAVAGFLRLAGPRLPWKLMLAWVIAALLPYLILRSQSYPYYGCLALVAYPWIIARAAKSRRRGFGVCVGLAMASSLGVYCAEPFLPRPAPIARAVWAEQALADLSRHKAELPPAPTPIALIVKDDAAYAAGGYSAGPALALGISQARLVETTDAAEPHKGWILTIDSHNYLWTPP